VLWGDNTDEVVQQIVQSPCWNQYVVHKDGEIEELKEENRQLQRKLAVSEGTITRCERQIKILEDKVTDLASRSMRDNILVKNVAEEDNEDEEKLEEKVKKVFDKDLKIPTAEQSRIVIERIHRKRKQVASNNNKQPRHIVVKLNGKGKSLVMKHLRNLDRNSPIKICEQFPQEVHANRDKLWDQFIDARQQGKRARWNVDQLQIDGKTIKPPVESKNKFMDVTGKALELHVRSTPVRSKGNNHFQAHTVEISSADDVRPALKAICMDNSIAGASHMMYAYRVGNERLAVHNWDDDGEWGGGKKIMEIIEGNSVYNQLICVTRWASEVEFLGPSRFDLIKDVTNSAIHELKAMEISELG